MITHSLSSGPARWEELPRMTRVAAEISVKGLRVLRSLCASNAPMQMLCKMTCSAARGIDVVNRQQDPACSVFKTGWERCTRART